MKQQYDSWELAKMFNKNKINLTDPDILYSIKQCIKGARTDTCENIIKMIQELYSLLIEYILNQSTQNIYKKNWIIVTWEKIFYIIKDHPDRIYIKNYIRTRDLKFIAFEAMDRLQSRGVIDHGLSIDTLEIIEKITYLDKLLKYNNIEKLLELYEYKEV